MGQRGTKPKPSVLKERAGTLRKCRTRDEPKPEVASPPFPSWAQKSAYPFWKEIAPWLEENGLLTRLDQTALALLCEALAEYCECREIVEAAATQEEGGTKYICRTDKGNIIQHPAVGVMNKAWGKVVKLLTQFGMTPSSRSGLAIVKPPDKPDLLSQLIAGATAKN